MPKPDVTPCKEHFFSDIEFDSIKVTLLKEMYRCFSNGFDLQWIVKKLLTTEAVIWTIRLSLIGDHYINAPLQDARTPHGLSMRNYVSYILCDSIVNLALAETY